MNCESIKKMLCQHYEHHNSKYILGGRRQKPDYYYNTEDWKWYIDYVRNLGNLDEGVLPDSSALHHITFNFYDDKKIEKTRYRLCVKLTTTEDRYIHMEFYAITGLSIRYHYGRPALKLEMLRLPVFNIHIFHKTGEVYWSDRKGQYRPLEFNWWLNRLIRENDEFRSIFIDLLFEMSEFNRILKDIARTIRRDHFFLPRICINDACKYHTPNELVRSCTEVDLKVNFNKWNMNAAWYVAYLSEKIKESDQGMLTNISQKKLLSWIHSSDIYEGPDVSQFAEHYYADRLKHTTSNEDRVRMIARDYARSSFDIGIGISLRKNSLKTLEKLHNDVVHIMMKDAVEDELSLPLVPENSRFQKLRDILPPEFQWIQDTQELYDEGKRQHNCVFEYRHGIRADTLAIYHWNCDDRQYTIEFVKRGNTFEMTQMYRSYNRPADPKDVGIVKSYIQNVTS